MRTPSRRAKPLDGFYQMALAKPKQREDKNETNN
jgi:hypothetical protein